MNIIEWQDVRSSVKRYAISIGVYFAGTFANEFLENKHILPDTWYVVGELPIPDEKLKDAIAYIVRLSKSGSAKIRQIQCTKNEKGELEPVQYVFPSEIARTEY